ncbi:hypothetical protein F2Q68_00009460 [Brassica cretica]|uniref:Uncharacterized protein n=1 Tax=Brassica cretica TaxID=69181 RepID=A0A8S9KQQ2_BRACR|nr:hypothetical protein F2Q68_00009460 [Brassica cretica]
MKYPDFKSVCHARGYLDNDDEWLKSMSEGARTATPYQLRDMFVTFLNNCFVARPKGLWEYSWKSMSEDILHQRQRILGHVNLELDYKTLEQYTLIEVEKLMRMHDRSLDDIKDIPKINPVLLKELENSLWNQEMDYDVAEETLRHEKHDSQIKCVATGAHAYAFRDGLENMKGRGQVIVVLKMWRVLKFLSYFGPPNLWLETEGGLSDFRFNPRLLEVEEFRQSLLSSDPYVQRYGVVGLL